MTFAAGVPVTASVTAAPSTILPNGTTSVTATIVDTNSNPVANETVTFAIATNNSGGSLVSLTGTTNASGQVTVGYTAGAVTAVTDIIRATTANTTTDTVNVDVSTGQVSVGGVSLFTGATELEADGSSTIVLRATVTDTDGQTVAGKSVTFVTSAGSFTTANPVTTDNFGEAEITLQSSANLGAAVITANSEGVAASAVTVQFVAGDAATATLTASPASVALNGQTTLLATIVDSNGHALANQSVTFAIDTNNTSGQLGSTVGITDGDGRATVLYTAGPVAGSDTLSVTTPNSTTVTVVVAASASNAVLGSLSFVEVGGSGSIIADGTSSTLLRFTLLDTGAQPIQGLSVSITTTAGDLNTAASTTQTDTVTTDVNGGGQILLFARTNLETATVIAAVGGLSKSLSVGFIAGPADAVKSSITATPSTLPADGSSTTTVTVLLLDEDDHLVSDGTTVTLQSTAGTIGVNTQTTSNGRAEFTITAPLSESTATLSVTQLAGLSGTIVFGTASDGEIANIQVSAANSRISVAGVGQIENTTVAVTLVESNGNPIDEGNSWELGANNDNTLRVSFISGPNGGEIVSGVDVDGVVQTASNGSSIDVTTQDGSAQLSVQAGTLPGAIELRIEALDSDGAGGAPYATPVVAVIPQISIASGPADTIILTSPVTDAIENVGGGVYRRKLTAIVSDRYGNSVADGTVVNVGLVDTVLAQSTTGETTTSSTTFTDNTTFLTDGSATDFINAEVVRNGVQRFIEANDRMLITTAAAEDKSRFVGSVSNVADIEVQSAYQDTETGLTYRIGASMLGGTMFGVASDNSLVPGTSTTVAGLANLTMQYPADINAINTGLVPVLDTRVDTAGSATVLIVASSSSGGATTISEGFYFAPIAGFTVTGPAGAALSGGGGTVTFTYAVRDGGDTVRVPFWPVSAVQTGGDFAVTVSVLEANSRSSATGTFDVQFTVPGAVTTGDTATVVITAGDGTLTVTITAL